MKVELDFDLGEDELRTLWCMMAQARMGQKSALQGVLREDEGGGLLAETARQRELFIYYSAALGAYADVLALAAPEDLQPDGSETQKP